MNRVARRAGAILLLAAVLLGGVGFFLVEYFVNGGNWAVHPGSPHVYNGGNIGCGLVTDRNGQLLMDLNEGRTYAATLNLRKSTVHWLGDRQGNISAPTLARYSKELAGYDALSGLYSYSGEGKAELTLSAKLQQVALEAMGEYKGTIAIYNYQTGEILCAVTTPTYDPDQPPEIGEHTPAELDGLYLNRFTQSVYIPGSIFKIVTTAAALEEIDDIRQQTFECTGKRTYGPDAVTCEKVHGTLDFDSAMAQSCNCAYASIVDQLGAETLEKYVKKYRVIESLQFEGITTAKGNFDASGAAVQAAWSGIGQHKDQINPAAFLNFVGAIANGGKAARPYLVSEIRCGNSVTYRAKTVRQELYRICGGG